MTADARRQPAGRSSPACHSARWSWPLTTTTKASGAAPPDRITIATNNFPYNVLNAQRKLSVSFYFMPTTSIGNAPGINFPIFSIWKNDAYPHQTADDVQMGAVIRVTEVIHVTNGG
jgi:hypothetical protein